MDSTTDQLSLFTGSEADLQARFEAFDRDNPQVYQKFRQFAYEARRRRQRYGAKSIMERCRWHADIETTGSFKINNSWTSRYARKLIHEDASFADFFETRALKS